LGKKTGGKGPPERTGNAVKKGARWSWFSVEKAILRKSKGKTYRGRTREEQNRTGRYARRGQNGGCQRVEEGRGGKYLSVDFVEG